MRNRFFVIILTTLILAALGFNGITAYFFRNQRINLIDTQIGRTAHSLLAAGAFKDASSGGANKIESVITSVLGPLRIGKIFMIRDLDGKIVYQSLNMAPLQAELPTKPEWITVEAQDQYVRIFNAPLTVNKVLQVGLVLDRNFLNWTIFDAKTAFFILGLVMGLFAVAAVLTLILLSPIRLLSAHLSGATSDLKNLKDVDQLPEVLVRFTGGFWARSDEFSTLIRTVQKLINRINRNYKLTRTWTLQMAHELKTPLAIIRSETESHVKNLPADYARAVMSEVDWTSETITQFLSWAELENAAPNQTYHVVRMSSTVTNAKARLDKLTPHRVDLNLVSDFSVAANPGHLDQLVTNILTNALKFSAEDTRVEIEVKDQQLTIRDRGPGIEAEVVERIGEPFNLGFTKSLSGIKGTGLGLAWVSTVAKLYDWKLEIRSLKQGTAVSVTFPRLD